MSERLRRWTRNPLGSARRGSNPLGVAFPGRSPFTHGGATMMPELSQWLAGTELQTKCFNPPRKPFLWWTGCDVAGLLRLLLPACSDVYSDSLGRNWSQVTRRHSGQHDLLRPLRRGLVQRDHRRISTASRRTWRQSGSRAEHARKWWELLCVHCECCSTKRRV